ncbi:MAG: DinB family protein [Candidatus Tectimicrobiota bacterium]
MELKTFIEQTLEECKRRLYRSLQGLTPEELHWRPGAEANAIDFMLWHVARVEDRWIHRFAQDTPEVWVRDGWCHRCRLPEQATGVNYTVQQLADFPVLELALLQGYFDAVRQETLACLRDLPSTAFDVHPQRIPFPEVSSRPLPEDFTVGRMFRQLIGEENQHLGQIAYLRGWQRGLDQ